MKRRDLIKILEQNGFYFLRNGADHDVYTNGKKNIPVPRHKEIKEILVKKIKREMGD